SLGLIGAGGSILTIPILVDIADISPVLATSYSLIIVGAGAATASLPRVKNKQVDFKKAIYFGIPSIISVILTRSYILPNISEELFRFNGILFTKDILIMLSFAVIMFLASFSMIKGKKDEHIKLKDIKLLQIISLGVLVGFIAGFVGAGGGFLIVPALVTFTGMKVKKAIGTSLFIIAINSLFGFVGDLIVGVDLDYVFLFFFIAVSFVGIYIGNALSTIISG